MGVDLMLLHQKGWKAVAKAFLNWSNLPQLALVCNYRACSCL